MGYETKGVPCGFCGQTGHKAVNCPKLAEHNRKALVNRNKAEQQGGC